MKRLLVITSAPASVSGDSLIIDAKSLAGMRYYAGHWPGPVTGMYRASAQPGPFTETISIQSLPFKLTLLQSDYKLCASDIVDYDVVLCGGDDHRCLHVAELCRNTKTKLIYIIENIPETRRQITLLDQSRSIHKKGWTLAWLAYQERRRRRAFRIADGLQVNGYPAFERYGRLNSNAMMFLDSRALQSELATESEMDSRCSRLNRGSAIRLLHSGRLEPLKGSQDLVPIARRLTSHGLNFTLDVFGAGSLETEIRSAINKYGASGNIRLHGPVDYHQVLVPFAREHADIYLSCHRQSDPSCTYLESMACGLAVAGYSNKMWSGLCRQSGAGVATRMGDVAAICEAIVLLSGDRPKLVSACRSARQFAGDCCFEKEVGRRMDHLIAMIQ